MGLSAAPLSVRPTDGTNGADVLAAGADATANTTNQIVEAAFAYLFNGATWDRMRGDTTNGLDVDVTRSALPSGASTSAKQDTMITHLATIAAALTITDAYVTSIASADTAAHAFGSQVVVAPVTITIAKAMTGTLTIDDGDAGAVVMQWDTTDGKHYPSHTFHVANLSQLRYTFSVNAGTEIFYISSAT